MKTAEDKLSKFFEKIQHEVHIFPDKGDLLYGLSYIFSYYNKTWFCYKHDIVFALWNCRPFKSTVDLQIRLSLSIKDQNFNCDVVELYKDKTKLQQNNILLKTAVDIILEKANEYVSNRGNIMYPKLYDL